MSTLLIALVLLLAGCEYGSTSNNRIFYIESTPTFFDLRNGGWTSNNWIRKPENLIMVHETFKKIGYPTLISKYVGELSEEPIIVHGMYINKSARSLMDSLLLTYGQHKVTDKYYNEFWNRRKTEGNDSVVFQIIKEIRHSLMAPNSDMVINDKLINDTLLQLLRVEHEHHSITEQIGLRHFGVLKRLGFHQSAYNLLFEAHRYQDLDWNRDSLATTLNLSKVYTYPWFEDDIK